MLWYDEVNIPYVYQQYKHDFNTMRYNCRLPFYSHSNVIKSSSFSTMFCVPSGSVSLCVWNLLSPLSRHLPQYQCKHSTDKFQLKFVETRNSYAFYVSPTLFYKSAFVVTQEFTEYVCGAFVIDLRCLSNWAISNFTWAIEWTSLLSWWSQQSQTLYEPQSNGHFE